MRGGRGTPPPFVEERVHDLRDTFAIAFAAELVRVYPSPDPAEVLSKSGRDIVSTVTRMAYVFADGMLEAREA